MFMSALRTNEKERLEQIEAVLRHLRQVEADTAVMISAIEDERERKKARPPKAVKKRSPRPGRRPF